PPNLADQINPPQTDWYRQSISRGCSPTTAYPFGYTPHRARSIDPETGLADEIIVVPAAQAIGWDNGFGTMGLGAFDTLQTRNDPTRPMLILMAHDGDNAWGGGYSYYMEATPAFANTAAAAGYTGTVIEAYLADHPVPAGDIVHVEDGAWVNADADFGSPVMLNWNWPLVSASGQIDIAAGWAEDERNWAVITAAQNRVDTAEQIAGGVAVGRILHPDATATEAERAWHFFLGALNSGYMYFGTALDLEVKPTIACNEAVEHADLVIGDGSLDATPPTVWIPQRHPWNPGSTNFGPQYGYTQFVSNGDFWVWTFVYDVSGVTGVSLKYRVDGDGANPLSTADNETYAGGPEVGPWQSLTMTQRVFPTGNFLNDPSINFFELPVYIADEYYVQITGLRSVLVDYYVEATDGKGNLRRSPIQHVYIGDGSGSGSGGNAVIVNPDPVQANQPVTVSYDPTGGPIAGATQVYLHYGFDGWNPVISPDPAMAWNPTASRWELSISVPGSATQLDLVFNDGAGVWDNNNGQDWHFSVVGGSPPQQPWQLDGTRDADASLVASSGSLSLWAGVKGDILYVATDDAGEGNDHFVFVAASPGALQPAPWAKAGNVAAWDAYLADENDNGFADWFDAAGTAAAMTGPNGGVLEGTLNLIEQYGAIPDTLYLAVGPYPTADGAALLSTWQVPAAQNGDGHLDANEYAPFSTVLPGDCTGDWRADETDAACFVDALLGFDADARHLAAMDLDRSGAPDAGDIQLFVDLVTGE
ncbi:MAG: carbohydrate binding domain-containing protein, partial [Phycisphaerae bacterium]